MPLPAELQSAIARYDTWIDGELQKEHFNHGQRENFSGWNLAREGHAGAG